jgi:hypothetical protein
MGGDFSQWHLFFKEIAAFVLPAMFHSSAAGVFSSVAVLPWLGRRQAGIRQSSLLPPKFGRHHASVTR